MIICRERKRFPPISGFHDKNMPIFRRYNLPLFPGPLPGSRPIPGSSNRQTDPRRPIAGASHDGNRRGVEAGVGHRLMHGSIGHWPLSGMETPGSEIGHCRVWKPDLRYFSISAGRVPIPGIECPHPRYVPFPPAGFPSPAKIFAPPNFFVPVGRVSIPDIHPGFHTRQ